MIWGDCEFIVIVVMQGIVMIMEICGGDGEK